MYGACTGQIEVKTGRFANFPASAIASAAADTPQNAPGALKTQGRGPKNRSEIRPAIKNIFWNFRIFFPARRKRHALSRRAGIAAKHGARGTDGRLTMGVRSG